MTRSTTSAKTPATDPVVSRTGPSMRVNREKEVSKMSASPAQPQTLGASIELEIGGMTCASCAMRVEKKLNKLDGVTATVNYATEKARVSVPDGIDAAALIAEVEKTGYTAALPRVED